MGMTVGSKDHNINIYLSQYYRIEGNFGGCKFSRQICCKNTIGEINFGEFERFQSIFG